MGENIYKLREAAQVLTGTVDEYIDLRGVVVVEYEGAIVDPSDSRPLLHVSW